MNKIILLLTFTLALLGCRKTQVLQVANSKFAQISITNSSSGLWEYKVPQSDKVYTFEGPIFEVDGKPLTSEFSSIQPVGKPVILTNGVAEYIFEGTYAAIPELTLRMTFRVSDQSPFIRFCYELSGSGSHTLTKSDSAEHLKYFSTSFADFSIIKEIRFSEFNEMVHSFCLSERNMDNRQFTGKVRTMGPIITGTDGNSSLLVAYEHGSQAPDMFLNFRPFPDKRIDLKALKGNYYNGFKLSKDHPYRTVWLETGAIKGNEDELAKQYRQFVLRYMSANTESRKPYIFYNTWNFQERNKHWNKKPYLADMTLERMLTEIDIAHKMGIDVFVIDAGWFEKTGDWTPSSSRFPDGLKKVKEKLTGYGMKLGLWFNPTAAAISSNMLKNNRDCVKTWDGNEGEPGPVWETENSYGMCLVSKYRDAFADELIRLNKELGVTYYKWDAISQYGCNDPRHFHGTDQNTAAERALNFEFEVGRSMNYIVDKLCAACPEAIVDFDITEGNRSVGLGFLASGKYFLINNGPYYMNYNIPFDKEKDNWNIFFYPGPARGWICRTPLTYDKWFPSVLFLTHYLPDDPYENQSIAIGSLILGQNGIWGDLPNISKEGVDFFGNTLAMYKQVRDDITEAQIIRDGAVGGSPEVYEKINTETGKGAIVIFSSHQGKYTYISQNTADKNVWFTRGANVTFMDDGRAKIETEFNAAEAKIILFGVKQ